MRKYQALQMHLIRRNGRPELLAFGGSVAGIG
jgi:hypothetical protein